MRLGREEDLVFFEGGIHRLMSAPHDDSVELEPDVVSLRSRPEARMEDEADFALAHDVDVAFIPVS